MNGATYRNALIDFQTDIERAIDELEAAIADIVTGAEDEILVEGDDGVTRVDATELKDLLGRLAEAPEAVTGAFRGFGWEVTRAIRALKQALVRETVEG